MSAEFNPNSFYLINDLYYSIVTTPRYTGYGKKNLSFITDEAVARLISGDIKRKRYIPDSRR
jgi:hypothetical protein